MRKNNIYVACLAILISGYLITKQFSARTVDDAKNIPVQSKPLKYVICSNEVGGTPGNEKSSWRDIEVLMDERAFSEDNLKLLYKVISHKYPSPETLVVVIHTSFDQISNPDSPRMSEKRDNPEANKHHRAGFRRRPDLGEETISFTINPPSKEMKMISVKEK